MSASPTPAEPLHESRAQQREHWVRTPQARLKVRRIVPTALADRAGTGHGAARPAPIVLLHESLGCIGMWRSFAADLACATGREVIAYDRWGFGQSDARSGPMPRSFVGDEARQVWPALLAALGVERFVALGHSVGAGMALHAAGAWPQACEAVIAMSGQARADARTLQGIRDAAPTFAQPEVRQRLARHHGDKTDWVLSAWIDTWLSPWFADWSLDDALPRVRCPALVLHGEEDEYGSADHARHMARHVQGPAQLQLLPGLGHHPHLAQPQEMAQRVAAFLRECVEGAR